MVVVVVVVFAAFWCEFICVCVCVINARARFFTCEDLFKFQRFSIFKRRRARASARMIKHAITISTTIATFISLLLLLSAAIHVDFIYERSQIAQIVFFAVAGVIRPRFVRSVDALDFLQE